MAQGLVIHIEVGSERHTEVLAQERIRIGAVPHPAGGQHLARMLKLVTNQGDGRIASVVTGLLFLVVVVFLMAVPLHLGVFLGWTAEHGRVVTGWTVAGVAAGIALGGAAVWLPLRLGAQALRRMEF